MACQVTVVGASNLDISATSSAPLLPGDSNPGRVVQGFGGVGRNIAESLTRLGLDTRLITAYGDDAFARLFRDHAAALSMDDSLSLCRAGLSSSVYICVNHPDGDISVAVSDMGVCEALTPDFLRQRLPAMNRSRALVLEANLTREALAFLAENVRAPLYADCVSFRKAERLKGILPRLAGIKVNAGEAAALTGLPNASGKDASTLINALHDLGVGSVLFTLGSAGAVFSNGRTIVSMPSLARKIVNTTGCGDACLAGMVYAALQGSDEKTILTTSLVMAALCAASPHSVAPELSAERLALLMKSYKEEAQWV